MSIAGRMLKRKVGADLLRKLPHGGDKARNRGAIIARATEDPDFLPKFYTAFQNEASRYETGVDTGLLVNSLQYGKPGNYYAESAADVTVGTQVQYANWYDALRRIAPDRVTDEQQSTLDRQAAAVQEKALLRLLTAAQLKA
jgi:hypothetical protein